MFPFLKWKINLFSPTINSVSRGSGYPLVLLHAFPLTHEIWKNFVSPDEVRLILPDFPGFGLSPLPKSEFSLSDVAQGLYKHLMEKGIDQPVALGGISMGGYWCLEFMRQFPEKVSALILISTRASTDSLEAKQKRLETAEKVEKEGVQFLVRTMLPGLIGKTTSMHKPEVIHQVGQWIQESLPQAVSLAQRAMARRRDQNDLLPKIKVPVLVLSGSEDTLIPVSEAQTMANAAPNSQFKIIRDVGHLIPLENPNEFQKCLNEFMSQHNSKRPA
jgi:pimeloyl-ACP methyl ester carboxylesterase